MGGLYGDMLTYFPELMDFYDVFSMKKSAGAGLSERVVVFPRVWGYFTRNRGGKESVVTDLRTENQQATFACEDHIPKAQIKQGLYLEDSGELYQFVLDNSFSREGGFTEHLMQLVVGNTDKQTPHLSVNLGLDEYQ